MPGSIISWSGGCLGTAAAPLALALVDEVGDPAKLAEALVRLAALEEPPLRFAAGADAVELFETEARTLLDQADAHRGLSSRLAHDEV